VVRRAEIGGFAGRDRARGGVLDDSSKHRDQPASVVLLHGDAAGFVILVAHHFVPVDEETGVAGDSLPEHALSATVALAERMNVVQLVVEVGEATDEIVWTTTLQVTSFMQFRENESGSAFDWS